jgi:RNA polymerase sigma factor (sigma-70 family)
VNNPELVPHLFRTEYSKIIAVLCKRFGFNHIEIAEDIASETFASAMETWTYKGIPENPTAWLYAVASNKAINLVNRNQLFASKISTQLKAGQPKATFNIELSDSNILDSQLRMLFTICNPMIPAEAQIGLALRILCGFGIDEIADAFLSNKETINKRLFRAKEKLREAKVELEFPGESQIAGRLENVLRTLYLLFNEGYYSERDNKVVREDLCFESMRLTKLLLEGDQTNLPEVNALFALMCFHASRFNARKNNFGEIILYDFQDESRWDQQLISDGAHHLHESSHGNELSKYHLEASIAYWHTLKKETSEKWTSILKLYDLLVQIDPSPAIAMNRIVALSKVAGSKTALAEALKLTNQNNHFYFALLGELYTTIDHDLARKNFELAASLATTASDRHTLQEKLRALS